MAPRGAATPSGTGTAEDVLAVLRRSHDRLRTAVEGLDAEAANGPSYHAWTIAAVLSHLGSSAELFSLFLEAGRDGEPVPGVEEMRPVWDRWNAKAPDEQVRDGLAADIAFLDRVAALPEAERARWTLSLFGADRDLSDLVQLRLAEHVLHTWDVVIAHDPAVTLTDEAAGLVLQRLPWLVERVGKPVEPALTVRVSTTHPARELVLDLSPDGARLAPSEDRAAAGLPALRLPAEALVRLVYGRLDPDHTPSVEADGVDLDVLRRAFPGV